MQQHRDCSVVTGLLSCFARDSVSVEAKSLPILAGTAPTFSCCQC